MNAETTTTATSNAPSQDKILALSFNSESSALAMGTNQGYYLFAITQNNISDNSYDCEVRPVVSIADQSFRDVHIIERVFSSPFVGIVSAQETNNLYVFAINKDNEIYKNHFSGDILGIKFSRSRVIVCLEKSISLFDLRSLRILHTIDDIPSNPNGLCAVSVNKEHPYLAYPSSTTVGDIQIFDTIQMNVGILIHAHTGPLAAMSFDISGEKIASASNKGTVIRVHSAIDGSRLFEFRRGIRRFATIYSLAFSPDSTFLATSSNTGTIHIFRLISSTANTSEEPTTWMNSVGRMIGSAAYYLPGTSEVLSQDRSFATIHLRTAEMRTIITMKSHNGKLILFVAGYDGMISTYEINTNEGGECRQLSQCALFDICADSKSNQLISNVAQQNKQVEEYLINMTHNDNQSTFTTNDTTFYSVKNTITEESSDSD